MNGSMQAEQVSPDVFDDVPATVLGCHVEGYSRNGIVNRIVSMAKAGEQQMLAHHNVHSVYLRYHDPVVGAYYEAADHTYIDGLPITILGWLNGGGLNRGHRQTSLDYWAPLMDRCVAENLSVFYLGSRQEVLDRAIDGWRAEHPGLRITGHQGYFALDDAEHNAGILAEIQAASADIVVLGMGMPRQEHWAMKYRSQLPPSCLILCIGALGDYAGGGSPMPPRWMEPIGLEWIYRLVHEPRRLGRRYLVEPLSLIGLVGRDLARGIRCRVRGSRAGTGTTGAAS